MTIVESFPHVHRTPESFLPRAADTRAGIFRRASRSLRYSLTTRCYDPTNSRKFLRKTRAKVSKVTQEAKLTPAHNLRKILRDNLSLSPKIGMNNKHSHPTAAANRTSVSRDIFDLVREMGYDTYVVSPAARDLGDGVRLFYGAKDLDQHYQNDSIKDRAVIIMIDTDYYADMPHWLSYGLAVIVYTFVPDTAGGKVSIRTVGKGFTEEINDATFSIKDDVIMYHVNGGACWEHKTWDYSGDTVTAESADGSGIVYDLDQYCLADDSSRRVVLLTPKAWIKAPCARELLDKPLIRKRFSQPGINYVHDPISDTISLSHPGELSSYTLTGMTYRSIVCRLTALEKQPKVADIEKLLRDCNDLNAATHATLLFSQLHLKEHNFTYSAPMLHFESKKPKETVRVVDPMSATSSTFQAFGALVTEEYKDVVRVIAPPLCSESAVAAAITRNNEVASIEGRITVMANTATIHHSYDKHLSEFAQHMVPIPDKGVFYSFDEVMEMQDRPAQRARTARAEPTLKTDYTNKVSAFIKKEAMSGTKDPRNISTVATDHTINASRATYAFKASNLKNKKWYGPGKTPEEVQMELAIAAVNGTICRDYTRFDGTISKDMGRKIIHPIYMRWAAPEYKDQMYTILKNEDATKAYTASGYQYEPGYSRKSGSPFTTDANTIINCAVAYCALRQIGLDSDVAWENLGLYCGDDGVDQNLPGLADALTKVSGDFGLKIKIEVTKKAATVPYCGRLFSDPVSCRTSIQDPKRTLVKMHLSFADKTVSDSVAAANKALGYLSTDAKTPIIGDWCRAVLKHATPDVSAMTRDEGYKMTQAWEQDSEEQAYALFVEATDMDAEEIQEVVKAIKNSTSIVTLPNGLINNPGWIKHSLPAVLGDRTVGPTPKTKCSPPKTQKDKSKSKQQCVDIKRPARPLCPPATTVICEPPRPVGKTTTVDTCSKESRRASTVDPTSTKPAVSTLSPTSTLPASPGSSKSSVTPSVPRVSPNTTIPPKSRPQSRRQANNNKNAVQKQAKQAKQPAKPAKPIANGTQAKKQPLRNHRPNVDRCGRNNGRKPGADQFN